MFIVDSDIGEEIYAQFLGFLDFGRIWPSDVKIHCFVGFFAGAVFHEAAATAFNLDSAIGFLLNMFDVSTTLTYDLCS